MAKVRLVKDGESKDPRVPMIFERVQEQYGFVPNILRALANCPELLEVFVPFWAKVYESPTIGERLRAIAALATAHSRQCEYCLAHMTESARRAGLGDSELKAILQGGNGLEAKEKAILAFAADVIGKSEGSVDSGAVDRLRAHFSDDEIVNITMAIGLYLLTSMFLQTLDIDIDAPFRRETAQGAALSTAK